MGEAVPLAAREAEIFVLNDRQVEHYWPYIEGLLDADPSLWDKLDTKEAIYEKISEGEYQVWTVCSGRNGAITTVFFTEILVSEVGRSLHLFWASGVGALHSPECVDGAVEVFARHHCCDVLLLTGRKGWERALKPLGWRFESVTLRKPVARVERRN